jgi:hypothetical protein
MLDAQNKGAFSSCMYDENYFFRISSLSLYVIYRQTWILIKKSSRRNKKYRTSNWKKFLCFEQAKNCFDSKQEWKCLKICKEFISLCGTRLEICRIIGSWGLNNIFLAARIEKQRGNWESKGIEDHCPLNSC